MSGSRNTVNPSDENSAISDALSPSCPLPPLRTGTLLDGRIRYDQFSSGYRTGIEPVLLAAAIPLSPKESLLEAGCGAGAGLLCAHARTGYASGVGLECDTTSVALANHNFHLNAHGPNVIQAIQAQVPNIPKSVRAMAPGANGRFHHVMANPPWHLSSGRMPADAQRRLALHAKETTIETWISALSLWVLPGGSLTVILPAGAVDKACASLRSHDCGSLQLYPFWPKAGKDAKLVIVTAIHGGKSDCRMRAGMVLHQEDGRFTSAAETVLREGRALPGLW